MTREEARHHVIAIIHLINGGSTVFKNMEGTASVVMDQLILLGMLKLDEPKSATERAVDAMFSYPPCKHGLITPRHAIEALDAAGLQIVEK